jgi:hypothetical protein
MRRYSRATAALLDIILARLLLAPRHDNDVLPVQRGDHVRPVCDSLQARIECLLRARVHVALDRAEERRDGGADAVQRDGGFGAVVAAYGKGLLFREISGADFETDRDALQSSSATYHVMAV